MNSGRDLSVVGNGTPNDGITTTVASLSASSFVSGLLFGKM